jgi:acyl dehydratase
VSDMLLTLEDMQAYVGTEAKPHVLHVEKELVRRFVEAIQDPNPLWTDEEYAKGTRYGGTIVPPQIFCAIMTIARCSPETGKIPIPVSEAPLPRENVLEGEEMWEFFRPLRVGDVITSHTRLADVKLREGRLGEMFILVYEAETTNQDGALVARSTNTLVNY